MKCPICQAETKVINSRSSDKGTSRRRECVECLTRFSTQEHLVNSSLDTFLQKQVKINLDFEPGAIGRWTKSETDFLLAKYKERIPYKEIAKALSRSYASVSQRIKTLRKKGKLPV